MRIVRLADQAFDPALEMRPLEAAMPQAGGLASFLGKVRPTDGTQALELSHYEPLTLPGMEALADQALARFDLEGLLIIHRIGVMQPGDAIVLVTAGARHRRAAIEAVDFTMDHLKSDAWFWKRELRADGWHWIEPRGQDHSDLARWQQG